MMLDWMMVEEHKKLKEAQQRQKGDVKHLNLPRRQRTRRRMYKLKLIFVKLCAFLKFCND